MLAIGVDMAKTTFTAARWHEGQSEELGTFPNTPSGFAALQQAVAPTDAPGTPAVQLPSFGPKSAVYD